MSNLPHVYLTGSDPVRWALNGDYNNIKSCLSQFYSFTNIDRADVLHTVTWRALANIPKSVLQSKKVFAHIPHSPTVALSSPEFWDTFQYVNKYIVPSPTAKAVMDGCGISAHLIPYTVDTEIFHKLVSDNKLTGDYYERYNIPENAYLIGSFQRDTEGKDLKTPKYMKGPDVFLAIVRGIYAYHKNICIILAGPRRFWLRKKLNEYGIPYVFVGEDIMDRDDLSENTLSHETINKLYNLVDLYIVGSRLEGGPKAILEASASECKIISSDVGNAQYILHEKCIYSSITKAINTVVRDIRNGCLGHTVLDNLEKAQKFAIKSNIKPLRELYKIQSFGKPKVISRIPKPTNKNGIIAIPFKFYESPWGGGNQFLTALRNEMCDMKVAITDDINNQYLTVTSCLGNSFNHGIKEEDKSKLKGLRFVHRIDGPTALIRGKDDGTDKKMFELNNKYADYTVFQSMWSLLNNVQQEDYPVNPVIIPNAVDPKIFNRDGACKFSLKRKIRIISTSWSKNSRKGWETYKWLDTNLDFKRYEYTFVGNVPGEFKNIKLLPAVPSVELAGLLKGSDIYITASKNDPCSNALIESLACGLPALYLNSGGHRELVGFGGLAFNKGREIPGKLVELISDYEFFQSLIRVERIQDIANRYLELFKR